MYILACSFLQISLFHCVTLVFIPTIGCFTSLTGDDVLMSC